MSEWTDDGRMVLKVTSGSEGWRGLKWVKQQVDECFQVLGTLVAPPLSAFVTVAVVTSGRGLTLRRGHSQSVGQLCSRQQEQHALHSPRLRERRARADERKQRRSLSEPSPPPNITCRDVSVFQLSVSTGCIHGNLFHGLNESHLCLFSFPFIPSCLLLLFEMLPD